MTDFQFRFAPLLRLRQRQRDAAAAELRQAQTAEATLAQQIEEVQTQRAHLLGSAIDLQVGAIDPQKMLEIGRYQLHLARRIAELEQQRAKVQMEVLRRRHALLEQERKVRSLERLRERQVAQWNAERIRREQNALDEWAGFRYWKKNAHGIAPAESDEA